MARILQTFHSNPALGGFGNESGIAIGISNKDEVKEGDCDAFAQIVKELVDNAVDACRGSLTIKRVRVDFVKVSENILRVTVTDNGCGMVCLQNCVEAFRSSKRKLSNKSKSNQEGFDDKTAGRYGIGLTLCLLHAQRLVPNSTASITSATAESPFFQRADYVVDTAGDRVKCIHEEKIPKNEKSESGTSVSVLVPGGKMSHLAWPRLAEYFARFQLSLGLPCSLEVMAPTLSKIPLFVRSPLESACSLQPKTQKSNLNTWSTDEESVDWKSCSDDDSDFDLHVGSSTCAKARICDDDNIRKDIQKAVSNFLKCNIDLNNVAHSLQLIEKGKGNQRRTKDIPTLEVDLIVYSKIDEDKKDGRHSEHLLHSAHLQLIRMVNRIPLLDGAEASSCGLVRGVANQCIWSSFGLSVNHEKPSKLETLCPFIPTYTVKDGDRVASFYQKSPHQLFENSFCEENQYLSENRQTDKLDGQGFSKSPSEFLLLPAHLRLGNMLMIIQINAKPSLLPLPTLSKSRLPMNDSSIDTALEAGVLECIKSLQLTNPSLLLTSKQLKAKIRDSRYIPAVAAALACVLCKSKDKIFQQHSTSFINNWHGEQHITQTEDLMNIEKEMQVTKLGPILEAKLRHVVSIRSVRKDGNKESVTRTKRSTRSNFSDKNQLVTRPIPPRLSTGSWDCTSPSPLKENDAKKRRLLTSPSSSSFDSDVMSPSPFKEQVFRKRRFSASSRASSSSFVSEIDTRSIDDEPKSNQIHTDVVKKPFVSLSFKNSNGDDNHENDDDEWW